MNGVVGLEWILQDFGTLYKKVYAEAIVKWKESIKCFMTQVFQWPVLAAGYFCIK